LLKNGANINALDRFGRTPYQTAMQYKHKESAECLRNAGIYKSVRGCWLCEPGADLPVRCSSTPPAGVQHPLENFGIPYLSCEYYLLYWIIETIDFRIREKIFKHQYGGSPCNVALFLIFARNTSTVRTNLTNKRSAQNAGNGISGLQISKFFWGENAPGPL
jgi:hypothetical protein